MQTDPGRQMASILIINGRTDSMGQSALGNILQSRLTDVSIISWAACGRTISVTQTFGRASEARRSLTKDQSAPGHILFLFHELAGQKQKQNILCWLALGGQTVKILRLLPSKFELDQSPCKSTQVVTSRCKWVAKRNASWTQVKKLASTCESVNNVKTGAKDVQSPPYLYRYGLAPPKDPFVGLWPKLCSILDTERVGHRRTREEGCG